MATKKKDGTLKKKYHDLPRYPVIYKYEADFKNNFQSMSNLLVMDITKNINKFASGRGK